MTESHHTIPLRICTGCGVPKPETAEHFHRKTKSRISKRSASVFRPRCKMCCAAEKIRWASTKAANFGARFDWQGPSLDDVRRQERAESWAAVATLAIMRRNAEATGERCG